MGETVYQVPVITNAWRVFHDRWSVSLPTMYLYDKFETENTLFPNIHGMSKTEMFNVHANANLTLAKIIDAFGEGADIKLNNYKDALPMYNLLRGHLVDLVDAHKAMMPIPCVEDLTLMDEMARTLHHSCLYIADPDKIRGNFASNLQSLSRIYRNTQSKTKQGKQNIASYSSVIAHLINDPTALGERVWL